MHKEFAEKICNGVPSNSQQEQNGRIFSVFRKPSNIEAILDKDTRNVTFFISMGKIEVLESGDVRFKGPYYHRNECLESHINIFRQMIEDDLNLIKTQSFNTENISVAWNFEVVITDSLQEYNYLKDQAPYNDLITNINFQDILSITGLDKSDPIKEKAKQAVDREWGLKGISRQKFMKLEELNNVSQGLEVTLTFTFWSDKEIEELKSSERFEQNLEILFNVFKDGYENLDKSSVKPITKYDLRYIFEEAIIFYLKFNRPGRIVLDTYPQIIRGGFRIAKNILLDHGEEMTSSVNTEPINSEDLECIRLGNKKGHNQISYLYAGLPEEYHGNDHYRTRRRREYLRRYYVGNGKINYGTDTITNKFYSIFCQLENKLISDQLRFEYTEYIPLMCNYKAHNSTKPVLEVVYQFLDEEVKSGELLLIVGDSGSGKSTFAKTLGEKVWSRWWCRQSKKVWYPILIEMKSITNKETNDLIEDHLNILLGTFKDDVSLVKLPLLIILDGFDEATVRVVDGFYAKKSLHKYQASKIIGTCTENFYSTYMKNQKRHNQFAGFSSTNLLKINAICIETEIKGYLDEMKRHADDRLHSLGPTCIYEDFKNVTENNYSLNKFASNPMILKSILYLIANKRGSFSDTTNVYESTIFSEVIAIESEKHLPELATFLKNVAIMMGPCNVIRIKKGAIVGIKKQGERIILNEYLDKNPFIISHVDSGYKHIEFVHNKIRDYILATIIKEEVKSGVAFTHVSSTIDRPMSAKKNRDHSLANIIEYVDTDMFLSDKQLKIAPPLITTIYLKNYLETLELLSDELDEELRRKLLSLVDSVRQDPKLRSTKRLCIASSNAMSILVGAHFNFSNMDLSHLQAPGSLLDGMIANGSKFNCADLERSSLRGAYFGNTNFAQAKLNGSTLSQAWLSSAIFHDTELEDTDFGEQPAFIHSRKMSCRIGDYGHTLILNPTISDFAIDIANGNLVTISANAIIRWSTLHNAILKVIHVLDIDHFTRLLYAARGNLLVLGTRIIEERERPLGVGWIDLKDCDFKYHSHNQFSRNVEHFAVSSDGKFIVVANNKGIFYFFVKNPTEVTLLFEHKHYQIKKLMVTEHGSQIVYLLDGRLYCHSLDKNITKRICLSEEIIDVIDYPCGCSSSRCAHGSQIIISTIKSKFIFDLDKIDYASADFNSDKVEESLSSKIPGLSTTSKCIAASGNLLVASDDDCVYAQNLNTSKIIMRFPRSIKSSDVKIDCHDGYTIAAMSGLNGDPIRLWKINADYYGVNDSIQTNSKVLSFFPDSNLSRFITIYKDGKIDILSSENQTTTKYVEADEVICAKLINLKYNDNIVILGCVHSKSNIVMAFRFNNIESIRILDKLQSKIVSILCNSTFIVVYTEDNELYCYKFDSRTLVCNYFAKFKTSLPTSMTLLAKDCAIIYADGHALIHFDFETSKKTTLPIFYRNPEKIAKIKISDDGNVIAYDSTENTTVIDLRESYLGEYPRIFSKNEPHSQMDLSFDGKYLLIFRYLNNTLHIYRLPHTPIFACEVSSSEEVYFVARSYNFIVQGMDGAQIWKYSMGKWYLHFTTVKSNSLICQNLEFTGTKISALNQLLLLTKGALLIDNTQKRRIESVDFFVYSCFPNPLDNAEKIAKYFLGGNHKHVKNLSPRIYVHPYQPCPIIQIELHFSIVESKIIGKQHFVSEYYGICPEKDGENLVLVRNREQIFYVNTTRLINKNNAAHMGRGMFARMNQFTLKDMVTTQLDKNDKSSSDDECRDIPAFDQTSVFLSNLLSK